MIYKNFKELSRQSQRVKENNGVRHPEPCLIYHATVARASTIMKIIRISEFFEFFATSDIAIVSISDATCSLAAD